MREYGRVWGPSVGQGLGPPKRPGPNSTVLKRGLTLSNIIFKFGCHEKSVLH